MNKSGCAGVGRQVRRGSLMAGLAACAALFVSSQALGQSVPYQYSQHRQIGSAIGQKEIPKGGVFQARIDAALQYGANLELAPDDEQQVDSAGLELAPGFYASYSGAAFIGAIDYSLIGRAWDESDYNDVTHRLSANGKWYAVPEWFSINADALYFDTPLDPRVSLDMGGLGILGQGNLAETASASVRPALRHRFNDFEAAIEYSYGATWYLDEGKGDEPIGSGLTSQDSTDQSAKASFGTADTAWRLSGGVFYEWQKSEYDLSLPYEFERVGMHAAAQLSRTLFLVGDYGKESDLESSTSQGGLDEDFWSAGLRWEPSDRSMAEARFGQRFFGDSYSFALNHRARILELYVAYTEEPTVETRSLSLRDFDPGTLPPGAPVEGIGRINSAPFVAKDAIARVTAVGSRTTLSLSGFQYKREYIKLLDRDETLTGTALEATRQFASNLSGEAFVSYSDWEWGGVDEGPLASEPERDYDTQLALRLNRKAGARLTISGETGYLTRSGSEVYDGWWVALRAKYEP